MARNKFDVDERLETPFDFRHLKRVGVYIGKHKWKMLLALLLSALASVTSLAVPKITQTVMDGKLEGFVTAYLQMMAE